MSVETSLHPQRMPILFVGHGSPMNIIEENPFSRGMTSLSGAIPRPVAILAISAHWFVDGTYLTGDERPRTIHDFQGFPQSLYEIDYPARGDVELARKVSGWLGESRASVTTEWGLDHGTWGVLHRMFPEADVPVVQMSIDRRLEVGQHLELAARLAPLREESVLILASGNIVHNLDDAFRRRRAGSTETPDWARRFDETVMQVVAQRDTTALRGLWPATEDGRLAHPTPEHFLPLVYAYGAADERDAVRFPIEGFDLGSLSMRSIRFG